MDDPKLHAQMCATLDAPNYEPKTADQVIDETIAKLQSGEIELPPEAMNEPPPEVEWYRCKYGHLQRGDYYVMSRDPVSGEVAWQSGPMCARCQAEWLSKKFQTRRVPPPEKQ